MTKKWNERVEVSELKLIVEKLREYAPGLGAKPEWLLAIIGFETAGTYSYRIKNRFSGAYGLIQFMPKTISWAFGLNNQQFEQLDLETQLGCVKRYFDVTMMYRKKPFNFNDFYMAVLWPSAIGQPDDYVLFSKIKTPVAYRQNKGLDHSKKGYVTRADASLAASKYLPEALEILEALNEKN